MKRVVIAVIALLMAGMLASCGERPQVLEYKQGHYQGKQDTPPWSNPPYNGDRTKWETDIKARNQAQNEYRRMN